MDAAAWAGCSAALLILFFLTYLVALSRALRNEQVISGAIVAMRTALGAEPPPQRALLRAVADSVAGQERAAARVEVAVHELTLLRGDRAARASDVLTELLNLPEPQLLISDFLREHAGGPGSRAAFVLLAADMLRAATAKVFIDLADQGLVELDRLLVLADEGRIADVALASLDSSLDPNPPARRVPGVADLDPRAMAAIVTSLDGITRRQLRLATVLHGQAEAMLRFPRRERYPVPLWMRLRALAKFPPPVRAGYATVDLDALAVALDACGEAVDTAGELVDEGRLVQAAHLLAGVRVPVPEGLPGRMYLQESLALARPIAKFGVWHRLAVCRWAASTLRAIPPPDFGEPDRVGST